MYVCVCFSSSLKAGQNECPSSKAKSPLHQRFHSVRTFDRLYEAHSHQGGQSALPSLPIQMLISPRNTLTSIPRISDQDIWVPCGLVELIHKMNHHKYLCNYYLVSTIVNVLPYLFALSIFSVESFEENKDINTSPLNA